MIECDSMNNIWFFLQLNDEKGALMKEVSRLERVNQDFQHELEQVIDIE
jgi:hypothetical protein